MRLFEAGTRGLRVLLVAVLALGSMQASASTSVAMLTDVRGGVHVGASAQAPRASVLEELGEGAQLHVAPGGQAVFVYLASGQAFRVDGPAVVRIGAASPRAESGQAPVASGPALGAAADGVRIEPVQVTQAALVMRTWGQGPRLRLRSPVATTILEVPPTLRWDAPEPGLAYAVTLLDAGGAIVHEARVEEGAELTLPAALGLREGQTYTWMVSARGADGRNWSNAGDFRIAAGDVRAREAALRPGVDAPVSQRVAFAAWLEQNGLREAARPVWQALAREFPEDARLQVLAGD